MKNNKGKKLVKLQVLRPEEMSLIRAGGKKPEDPKTPDEGLMML